MELRELELEVADVLPAREEMKRVSLKYNVFYNEIHQTGVALAWGGKHGDARSQVFQPVLVRNHA